MSRLYDKAVFISWMKEVPRSKGIAEALGIRDFYIERMKGAPRWLVPLRYLLAFAVPVLLSVRAHLRNAAASPKEAERMESAWTKVVMLSIALWAEPYAREGLW